MNAARAIRVARLLALIGLISAGCAPLRVTVTEPQTALPVFVATLAPPLVTAQPELAGTLWVDRALGDIWRLDIARGAVAPVLLPGNVFPSQPAVPPAGAPLAYSVGQMIGDGFSNRFGLRIGTDQAVDVLPVDSVYSYQDPAFSPDGSQLYATRIGLTAGAPPGASASVIVRAARGTGWAPTVASVVRQGAAQPSIAPDGGRMVYISLDNAQPPTVTRGIHVLDLDTGQDREIIPPARFYDVFGPRWLDAGHIVFSALETAPVVALPAQSGLLEALLPLRAAHAHTWTGDVWLLTLTDGALRKLTATPLQAPIAAPAPDGRQIAVLSLEGIWVLDLADGATAPGAAMRRISASGGNGGLVWTR